VGGYLALWFSWRGIFFALAIYGVGTWLLAGLGLKETLETRIATLRIGETLRGDAAMLGNLQYSAYLLVYGIAFGSLLGYYATTPYLFTRELGFASYQYGYLLIFNVAFYVAGVQASRLATRRWGIERPLMLAMIAYALSTAMFLVVEIFAELDTLSVLIPISVFIFGAGLVSPAANAGAMTIFRERAVPPPPSWALRSWSAVRCSAARSPTSTSSTCGSSAPMSRPSPWSAARSPSRCCASLPRRPDPRALGRSIHAR
jgi:DHA1 family bicyclomycin/chloramphenicol resistance-like MFS transporter